MFSYTRWNKITSSKILAVVEGTKNENIICLKGPWFEALELQSHIRKFISFFCFFLYVFHGIRNIWQFLLEYSQIYSNVCYRWHMLDWISRVTALWDVLSQLHYLWDIPCWREAALLLFPPTMRSTFQRNKCMTNNKLTTSSSRLLSALLMNKQVLATVSFTLFHMYGEATKGYKFAIMINILVTCMWFCLCLFAFWFNCVKYSHILVF